MSLADKVLFKVWKQEPSYSQCGEDKILKHLFADRGVSDVNYLDVGTNHPVIHNNTYYFYRAGGRGVCVEPNPDLTRLIRRQRPRDVCLNVGVTPGEDSEADYFCMSANSLNTFVREDADALQAGGKFKINEVRKIQVRNINSIIDEHFETPVDLVSIDVEGWNEEIVKSIDFRIQRPFCFCIETLNFSDTGKGLKLKSIIEFMRDNGYVVYADTHINTIFVDERN
jgi:FkbM family methyltransferase